jgi:O-antigen ligase
VINPIQNFCSNKLPSILLVLLPFFLITGPFLSDLSISAISLIFLIKSYYNEKLRSYYKNNFFYFFLFFWIYLLINTLVTFQNIDSLRISFFYIRFIVFVVATWYLLDINKKIILYLFYSFLFCFCILIFDGFYQFFFKVNIFGWEINFNRISSFFGQELILGSYLSRLYPIFFATYIFSIKSKKNLYIYIVILVFVLTETLVFLSGERSSFIFINLSAIFIFIMAKNFKGIRTVSICLSLLLIVTITQFDNSYKRRLIDNTIDQIGLNSNKINIFSIQHQAHYLAAFKIFKDNPIFGIGVKNFRFVCKDKKYNAAWACSSHPHNTYIQLLAETGIIGFIFIFTLFIYFLYLCGKHLYFRFKKKKFLFKDSEIFLLSSILISLWPLVPTGNFFNNWLCIIYALPCGILFWSLNNNDNKLT